MSTAEIPAEVLEARRKLREKMGDNGAKTGGKGSVRRKSAPIPKSSHNDDRKVGEVAKKAGLQEIPGIEEANIIMEDGSVIQFSQPKLRGVIQANSFVLHGSTIQTQVNKLSPEMRGDVSTQARGPGIDFAAMGNTMKKIQQVMESGKYSQDDLKDPKKTQEFHEALLRAGVTEEELRAMQQGISGELPGKDDDELPELSGDKNFEDISDAD